MSRLIESFGVGVTVAVFAVAAVGVWIAGARLSRYADAIAVRTGLGQAFVGVLFLGVATSLPELATTVGAVLEGHPTLAGTNLLGGVAMQIAVLAAVDGVALRGRALTHFSGNSAFLMQGVFLVLLLGLASAAIAIGDRPLAGGLGDWPVVLAAVYVLALFVMYRYENEPRWEPIGALPDAGRMPAAPAATEGRSSLARLMAGFGITAGVVLASGYIVALSAAHLAGTTGLDESFVGATLVALATSLPEVSTTWSAVRMGAYAMAVGNIFGTNALELALFLPADALHTDGPILAALDQGAAFLAALGVVLTCIYLWGVLERRDRVVLNFGIDSALVVVVYVGGMALFFLSGRLPG